MVHSNYQKYLASEDKQLFQMLVGLFSILSGMLVAGAVIYLLPRDLSSLDKAQQLGIISRTVLDGYPKQLEIPYYILGVVISLLSGLCIFSAVTCFHYRKKGVGPGGRENFSAHATEKQKPRMGLFRWLVLALVLFLVTFHKAFIYKNWYWVEWGFLFEEGIYFRWINELLRGGILYKDLYFYGAPFMVWPQYWLMKLFGPSIALSRYYTYFCYFVGYLIVFKVLRETIKNRILMSIGMLLIIYFYYPMFPGFHRSLGRFAISLLPLYFLYKYFFHKGRLYLLISGASLGFALLFSQELGIGSLVAVGLMVAAFNYREGGIIKSFPRQLFFIAIGASILLLPVLAYFSFHRALPDLYEAMITGPRYYAMGIWGYKFPSLFQLLRHSRESRYDIIETLLAYWPIMFYIGSVFFCLALFLRKSFTNRNILFFGVATLGGIMFQRAFGIYYLFQIRTVIYPLVVLSIGYLDMAWPRTSCLIKKRSVAGRKVEILLYAVLLVFIAFGLYGYSQGRGFWPGRYLRIYLARLKDNESYIALNLSRAKNVYLPPERAYETNAVVEYIKRKTRPDEPIYVFPYSPMYYFLADRPSPVKYPVIYTITRKYREQVLGELKEKRVEYIIYVEQRHLSGVTTEMRYPEIVDYIHENYQPVRRFDNTTISRRKDQAER